MLVATVNTAAVGVHDHPAGRAAPGNATTEPMLVDGGLFQVRLFVKYATVSLSI